MCCSMHLTLTATFSGADAHFKNVEQSISDICHRSGLSHEKAIGYDKQNTYIISSQINNYKTHES